MQDTQLQYTANFIGHDPAVGEGDLFHAMAPASAETLPDEFTKVTAAQADLAVDKAAAAFSVYAGLHPHKRAEFLDAIATEIEALGSELIDRAVLETGLPVGRITGERGRTTGQLRLFANLLREGSWVDARINPAQPDRTHPCPGWTCAGCWYRWVRWLYLGPVTFRWHFRWRGATPLRHWRLAVRWS
jgi:NADP-dependent aldehyde dehydrogenase